MKPHGIMFHHFCGGVHPRGQGAITADELADLIEFVGRRSILPADAWLARHAEGTLRDGDVCLTFDDNLRCQYDIALPVLRHYGVTAFWFFYSSPLKGVIERVELYRYFRTVKFDKIEDFYQTFFAYLNDSEYAENVRRSLAGFDPKSYLAAFSFYSDNDRTFRFIRDKVLGPQDYNAAMDGLLAECGFADHDELIDLLWIDDTCVRRLHEEDHVVGLHSHTHPTALAELSVGEQRREYERNSELLAPLVGGKPITVAHPCNSFNRDTLALLRELGVTMGFCSNMEPSGGAPLELPRLDHAILMQQMAAHGKAPA